MTLSPPLSVCLSGYFLSVSPDVPQVSEQDRTWALHFSLSSCLRCCILMVAGALLLVQREQIHR